MFAAKANIPKTFSARGHPAELVSYYCHQRVHMSTSDPFRHQASLESTEDLRFAIAHPGDWESLKFMPYTVSFTGYCQRSRYVSAAMLGTKVYTHSDDSAFGSV
jgi:hypothetical protein